MQAIKKADVHHFLEVLGLLWAPDQGQPPQCWIHGAQSTCAAAHSPFKLPSGVEACIGDWVLMLASHIDIYVIGEWKNFILNAQSHVSLYAQLSWRESWFLGLGIKSLWSQLHNYINMCRGPKKEALYFEAAYTYAQGEGWGAL